MEGGEKTSAQFSWEPEFGWIFPSYVFPPPNFVVPTTPPREPPRLTDGFETSFPGLHILGAPAVWSFGPLMQFVVGTHYSSRALMQFVARKKAGSRARVGEPLVAGLELSRPHD